MGGPDGVAVTAVELDALPGVPAFAVDAPPALIVIIGRLGAFGDEPDVVVSGINPGPNTGRSARSASIEPLLDGGMRSIDAQSIHAVTVPGAVDAWRGAGAKVETTSGAPVVVGGVLGLVISAFLGFLVYQGGHRIDTRPSPAPFVLRWLAQRERRDRCQ